MTRVLLADSQPLVRIGLIAALGPYGVDVVGDCGDARAMLTSLASSLPDVLLIDPGLFRRSALRCLRTVRRVQPAVAIIVFADHASGAFVRRMRFAGADAVLGRSAEAHAIAEALHRAAATARSPTMRGSVPTRRPTRGTRRTPSPAPAR